METGSFFTNALPTTMSEAKHSFYQQIVQLNQGLPISAETVTDKNTQPVEPQYIPGVVSVLMPYSSGAFPDAAPTQIIRNHEASSEYTDNYRLDSGKPEVQYINSLQISTAQTVIPELPVIGLKSFLPLTQEPASTAQLTGTSESNSSYSVPRVAMNLEPLSINTDLSSIFLRNNANISPVSPAPQSLQDFINHTDLTANFQPNHERSAFTPISPVCPRTDTETLPNFDICTPVRNVSRLDLRDTSTLKQDQSIQTVDFQNGFDPSKALHIKSLRSLPPGTTVKNVKVQPYKTADGKLVYVIVNSVSESDQASTSTNNTSIIPSTKTERTNPSASSLLLPPILSCKQCGKKLKSKTALKNHLASHKAPEEKPYSCVECSEARFATSAELWRHRMYKHSNYRPHKCQFCSYQSLERSKLVRHIRKHTDERPYPCSYPFCLYAAKDHFKLKRHMRTHTNEKPYICEICSRRFTQRNNLTDHIKTQHSDDRPKHQCPHCDIAPARKSDLMQHIRRMHTDLSAPRQCKKCPAKFLQLHEFSNHKKSHRKENYLQCSECDFTTWAKSKLKIHQITHMDKDICCPNEGCHFSTKHQSRLEAHVSRVHKDSDEVFSNTRTVQKNKKRKDQATSPISFSKSAGFDGNIKEEALTSSITFEYDDDNANRFGSCPIQESSATSVSSLTVERDLESSAINVQKCESPRLNLANSFGFE